MNEATWASINVLTGCVFAVSVCIMFFSLGYYSGVRKMKKAFEVAMKVFREQTDQIFKELKAGVGLSHKGNKG